MYHQVLIAGFGGQGVLSCGQILALAGMIENRNVTWMPSYGPEQRGGTARCVVTLADRPIGSPLAERLSAALIFNQPSLAKFLPQLGDGTLLILNSCIVQATPACHQHALYQVPADTIARNAGFARSGNMVMLGAYVGASGIVSVESVHEAIGKYLPPAKAHLADANRRALDAGLHYARELKAA
ncbi:MAG: 2-oxoacid:acceptor oxidoreductase family protein [Desulfobacteraceae bacterium]|nr:2-oxoacid:acceptor oxidoreductase family protein [Desulfobacteraceae bacterium]